MNTMLSKFEKALIGAGLTIAMFMVSLFFQVDIKKKSVLTFDAAAAFINYEMGRVADIYGEYSLTGRSIDREYESLKPKAASKAAVVTKVAAIKKADGKKKVEVAKSKAVAKNQPITNKPLPHSYASPKVSNDVIDDHNGIATNSSGYDNQITDANVAGPEAVTNEKNDKVDKNKKTYSQWRELIFASPTRESITAFIDAYRKNQVTSAEYQAMSQDLLSQSDEKYKGLGIMALRAHPSIASLAQLTHLQASALSDSLKTYLSQGLGTYLQTQNIPILNQALQSQDKIMIGETLTLLNSNLPRISQGDFSTVVDSRSLRSADKTNLTVSEFKVLLPALNSITAAQDAQLSPLAQQTTGFIQAAPIALL